MAEYDNKVLTGEQLGVFSGLVKTAINEKQDELVFNTAYNSTSNKVATMADIPAVPVNVSAFTNDAGYQNASQVSAAITAALPAPYVLPTASDTVLGGVKIDGTTITINDGVISASGASYTAGDGISIDENNVIDLLNNRTSLIPILYSILTRNSGMARQDGMIQALWRNRFARANIDYHIANLQTYRLTYFSDGLIGNTFKSLIDAISFQDTTKPITYYMVGSALFNDQYTSAVSQTSVSVSASNSFDSTFVNKPVLVEYNPAATNGVYWTFILYPEKWFQNTYFNSQQGLTSHSIAAAIDEVASQVSAKLTVPTAPSADGSYKLTSTITSGTAAYAWTADTASFSGSYNDLTDKPTIPAAYTLPTASTSELGGVKVDGTTITITDGVISAVASGGGGASYTAGSGIHINNDVISGDFRVLQSSTNRITGLSGEDAAYLVEAFNNSLMGYYFVVQCTDGSIYHPVSANATDRMYFVRQNSPHQQTAITFDATKPNATQIQGIGGDSYVLDFDILTSGSNYEPLTGNRRTSLTQVFTYIKNNYLKVSPPSSDGSYVLKCTVSSGVPTYTWIAET